MVRTPTWDKSGLKKGTWTPEEDRKLTAYITRYGSWNWRQLPRFAGLSRCGKSCRLRWLNYLRPNLKRGNYSKEEDDTIIRLHETMGNRWSVIAAQLPGRTDNEVKNYWHTALKKRVKKQNLTTQQTLPSSNPLSILHKNSTADDGLDVTNFNEQSTIPRGTESTDPLPTQSSSSMSSEFYCLATYNNGATPDISSANLIEDDRFGFINSLDTFAEFSDNFWTEPFLSDISYVVPNDEVFLPDYEIWSPGFDELLFSDSL